MFSKGLAHIACRDRDIALKTNPYVYHIKDTSFFNHHNKDNNRHHPPFLFFHAYNSTSFFSAPFNMIEGVGVYIHTGKRGGGVFVASGAVAPSPTPPPAYLFKRTIPSIYYHLRVYLDP